MDAFTKAIIHSDFRDPWSMETFCHLKKPAGNDRAPQQGAAPEIPPAGAIARGGSAEHALFA
jgi:hypothetical protein